MLTKKSRSKGGTNANYNFYFTVIHLLFFLNEGWYIGQQQFEQKK
jgi:hypothetical protein